MFDRDLLNEPHFVHESALHAQTYFADLFLQGAWNDAALAGIPRVRHASLAQIPLRLGALRHRRNRACSRVDPYIWYNNIHARFDTDRGLVAMRRISVVSGAVGCAAIYGLGVFLRDRRTGLLAAFFLGADALYRMHARRAMADALIEGLVLSTLLIFLWFWKRTLAGRGSRRVWLTANLAAGTLAGFAVLAKLNGALGLIILAAWIALTLCLPTFRWIHKTSIVFGYSVACIISLLIFILFYPTVTAHPERPTFAPFVAPNVQSVPERLKSLADFRKDIIQKQQSHPDFKINLLDTPFEKIRAAGDSRIRSLRSTRTAVRQFDRQGKLAARLGLFSLGACRPRRSGLGRIARSSPTP